MQGVRIGTGVIALAALAGGAMAQPPVKAGEIVVTARKPMPHKEARQFVNRISAPIRGQFARFRDPVCPIVYGMPPDYAAKIEQRMREVAADAHIPLAAAPCSANVLFVVAESGRDFVAEIYRKRPALFDNVTGEGRDRLLHGNAPVRAWSATRLTDEDGRVHMIGGAGPGDPPVMQIRTASIILLPTQQVIDTAVVVIDQQATIGKTLTQLADYGAMRAFARTREPGAGESDSILTLFDPQTMTAPVRLTSLDAAYLAGLYHGPANRAGYDQASIMSRAIVKRADSVGSADARKP